MPVVATKSAIHGNRKNIRFNGRETTCSSVGGSDKNELKFVKLLKK